GRARGRRGDRKCRRGRAACTNRASVAIRSQSMPQPANQNAKVLTAIPGPNSQALRAREDAHLAPGAQGYALMAGVVVDHAEGSWITDLDGNVFLDFIGGMGVGALGSSHCTWVEVLQLPAGRAAVGSLTGDAPGGLLHRV